MQTRADFTDALNSSITKHIGELVTSERLQHIRNDIDIVLQEAQKAALFPRHPWKITISDDGLTISIESQPHQSKSDDIEGIAHVNMTWGRVVDNV